MKHFDKNVTDELRSIRNGLIQGRWSQLHGLSKESGDSAIKYLFATNAGGAVAVLAYLGSIAGKESSPLSAKIALASYFIGLLFVGIYKAYMVHNHEDLFNHYRNLVAEYYEGKIGWSALTKSDETKVGKPIAPYMFGYISFGCFIFGSASGAFGVI